MLVIIVVVLFFLRKTIVQHVFTPRKKQNNKKPMHPYEDIEIKLDAGIVRGWLIKHERARGTFILLHGWGSNKSAMLRYEEGLTLENYNVLIIDVLGHGASDTPNKQVSIETFVHCLTATIDYIAKRQELPIYVLGHSMGGVAASILGSLDSRIHILVTDSMPTSLKSISQAMTGKLSLPYMLIGWLFTSWFLLRGGVFIKTSREWNFRKILSSQQAPALAIHSIYDSKVSASNTDLLEKESNFKQITLTSTPGHNRCVEDAMFWKTVNQFIRENNLKGKGDNRDGTF
ncbi:alpha/beta hydrolase [Metasolibacillus meyeri]|uniref:Alpha/beta hydrolase n=1 Tax=Metasolibacillus meyeri TaxID=1071052 RepID=A0AAW9NL36_9BACL|nr:alpha/beta hydrolase [Metasolibacillus meyeri]MEC1177156.1 alpha/beta hydrolase [Metasolibacillus meyeri]